MIAPGIIRPSIHMPRWASRILMGITGVRVERLRDINGDQALAEGIYSNPNKNGMYTADGEHHTSKHDGPVESFAALWESINGPDIAYLTGQRVADTLKIDERDIRDGVPPCRLSTHPAWME